MVQPRESPDGTRGKLLSQLHSNHHTIVDASQFLEVTSTFDDSPHLSKGYLVMMLQ